MVHENPLNLFFCTSLACSAGARPRDSTHRSPSSWARWCRNLLSQCRREPRHGADMHVLGEGRLGAAEVALRVCREVGEAEETVQHVRVVRDSDRFDHAVYAALRTVLVVQCSNVSFDAPPSALRRQQYSSMDESRSTNVSVPFAAVELNDTMHLSASASGILERIYGSFVFGAA